MWDVLTVVSVVALISLITISFQVFAVIYVLVKLFKTPTYFEYVDNDSEQETAPIGLEVNPEVIAWGNSFDERITKMKDELAAQRPERKSMNPPAEEMHPLVRNLPHDSVGTRMEYDDPEIAD